MMIDNNILKDIFKETKIGYDILMRIIVLSNNENVAIVSLSKIINDVFKNKKSKTFYYSEFKKVIRLVSKKGKGMYINLSKNGSKTIIEYNLQVKKQKIKPKNEDDILFSKIYNEIIIPFYIKIEYDYPDLISHKRYIKTISKKIEKHIKQKGNVPNDELVYNSIKLIFDKIDGWWIENNAVSLPTISKNLDKIINAIKNKENGKTRDNKSKSNVSAEYVKRVLNDLQSD